MNTKNLIISLIACMGVFSSCKKESVDNAQKPSTGDKKRIASIATTDGTYRVDLTYDAQKRLKTYATSGIVINFQVSPSSFEYRSHYNGTDYGFKYSAAKMINQRVTDLLVTKYNADGSVGYTDFNYYQYDQNGYQTGLNYSNYNYKKLISGGNTTKVIVTDNGAPFTETIVEYYTDKPNKMNFNWQENGYLNEVINDGEQFGTRNKNLIKRVYYKSSTYSSVTDFTYTLDAEGYVTGMKTSFVKNGGAPVLAEFKVTYF